MGFLEVGTPYEWPDSLDVIGYIREHGIEQFLAMWDKVKDVDGDEVCSWEMEASGCPATPCHPLLTRARFFCAAQMGR